MKRRANFTMPNFCSRRFQSGYTVALNILSRLGASPEQIDIMAVGEYQNFRGEILRQEPEPGENVRHDTRIVLEVGYSSAVDQMPYQFFYGMHGVTESTGEWEDKARRLMAPIDASAIRRYALLEFEDIRSNFGVMELPHVNRFLGLFKFIALEESTSFEELMAWTTVLPSFHLWAGNPQSVCRVLNYLYGYNFEIIENMPVTVKLPEECLYKLGSEKARLGKETTLGRQFTECDSGYELLVKDVPVDQVTDFLPGGPFRKKLEKALQVCMPSHFEHRIIVHTAPEGLPIGRKRATSYLGYSSYAMPTKAKGLA